MRSPRLSVTLPSALGLRSFLESLSSLSFAPSERASGSWKVPAGTSPASPESKVERKENDHESVSRLRLKTIAMRFVAFSSHQQGVQTGSGQKTEAMVAKYPAIMMQRCTCGYLKMVFIPHFMNGLKRPTTMFS